MRKDQGLDYDVIKAPHLKRKFRLWWHQWIGLPVLLAIPVLGLTGVLGDSTEQIAPVTDPQNQLEISGEYPKRLHYGKPEQIELTIMNKSGRVLNDVVVKFDPNYMKQFGDLMFVPGIEEAYRVKLSTLRPGESKQVLVSLRGEKYGPHDGKIEAQLGGRTIASVDVKSFVFP